MAQDVADSDRVNGHEPASADKATVNKGSAIGFDPSLNEIVVLLVMHFSEITHEEGLTWWTWHKSQR